MSRKDLKFLLTAKALPSFTLSAAGTAPAADKPSRDPQLHSPVLFEFTLQDHLYIPRCTQKEATPAGSAALGLPDTNRSLLTAVVLTPAADLYGSAPPEQDPASCSGIVCMPAGLYLPSNRLVTSTVDLHIDVRQHRLCSSPAAPMEPGRLVSKPACRNREVRS